MSAVGVPDQVLARDTLDTLVRAAVAHALVKLVSPEYQRITRAVEATYPAGRSIDSEEAIREADGMRILQDLVIDMRNIGSASLNWEADPDGLDHALGESYAEGEIASTIVALAEGPLGAAAGSAARERAREVGLILAMALAMLDSSPERHDRVYPERVIGADGKTYPASTAHGEAQRARIVALCREHPDWSARKIAREVGCSQNTVIAVDEVLAGAMS